MSGCQREIDIYIYIFMYSMQCFMRKPSEFSTCWTLHAIWGEKIHDTAQPTQALKMFEAGFQQAFINQAMVSTLIVDCFRSTRTVPLTWKNNSRKSWWTSALCIAMRDLVGIVAAPQMRNATEKLKSRHLGKSSSSCPQFRPCDLSQHTFFSYRISFSAMFVYWNAIPGSSHLYTK